ncbi:MAG: threonine/serine dehydratase [Bacteroidota bacterium]|nr:threonine/serine dehydratase [Bacteroidota bacterium]
MSLAIPSPKISLENIKHYIVKTPLTYSERLSNEINSNIFLKLENLQKTGSFKARGALNKILNINNSKDVVAASSGNHGAAVSYALSKKNMHGTIYVPENVKKSKVKNIESYGSKVVKFGDDCLDAENQAIRVSKENNLTFVSPYNDLDIVSGQGTIGVEILNDNNEIDVVFITVGGGGLISGVGSYLKSINPSIKVIGCSPINSSIMINSIKKGKIINTESKDTLSDGSAGGVEEGSITFDICKELIDDYCLVSEDEISLQIKNSLNIDKMLIEGSAAVAIASAIKMKSQLVDKNVVIVICGGNIGSDTLKKIL